MFTFDAVMAEKVDDKAVEDNVSEEAYLEKTFGFKTADEVKAAIKKEPASGTEEIAKELGELKTKYADAEAKLSTTATELETLKKNPPVQNNLPYKKDISRFVDELPFTDPAQIIEAITWSGTKVENLEAVKAIKLAIKLGNPGYTDAHADAVFNKDYVLDAVDAENPTDAEKSLFEAKLLAAANKSRESLKTIIGKKFEVAIDTTAAEREQKRKDAESIWSAKTPGIIKEMGKIERTATLKLPGSTGKVEDIEVKYSYQIPDNSLAELSTNMTKAAVNGMVPNTVDGENSLKSLAKEVITAQTAEKMQDSLLIAAQNKFLDFLKREFNVETAPGAGGGTGNEGKGAETFEGRVMADLKKKAKKRG